MIGAVGNRLAYPPATPPAKPMRRSSISRPSGRRPIPRAESPENLAPPAESAGACGVGAGTARSGAAVAAAGVKSGAVAERSARPLSRAQLQLAARYGSNLPQITNGLHWRIYPAKPDQAASARPRRTRARHPCPLSPGNYVAHVGLGLASATRVIELRADGGRETFEIPAGRPAHHRPCRRRAHPVGTGVVRSLPRQPVEPGDRRAIVQAVAAGDVILVPEAPITSSPHDGDGTRWRAPTSVSRPASSSMRWHPPRRDHHAQAGERVRRRGARQHRMVGAHARWRRGQGTIGAFPRVILAEGEYRVVARSDDRESPTNARSGSSPASTPRSKCWRASVRFRTETGRGRRGALRPRSASRRQFRQRFLDCADPAGLAGVELALRREGAQELHRSQEAQAVRLIAGVRELEQRDRKLRRHAACLRLGLGEPFDQFEPAAQRTTDSLTRPAANRISPDRCR